MTEAAAAATPKVGAIVTRAIVTGVLIAVAGVAPWIVLARLNVRIRPELPWAAVTTTVWLFVLLCWLNGYGWPRSTSDARRSGLRLWRPSGDAWSGTNLATILGLMSALVGLAVLRIISSPDQRIADLSGYPTTAFRISVLVMGATVSGVVEEAAFRGYMQRQLERIGPMFAIMVTSVVFVLMHVTHGLAALAAVAPGYFLVSLLYGLLAIRSGSILPGMLLHIVGGAMHTFVVLLGGDARLLIVK